GDFKLIDSEVPHKPETWVWTSADRLFLKLVQEVHSKGMRIIIDGVFNHMGLNSWVFRDIKENGKNSAYADWMKIKSWNDKEAGTKFEYDGWYGVKELPELKQLNGDLAPGPKKYIFDITKRWMDPDGDGDPADGIDGWRLDVAFMVGHTFWKDWRRHLKAINPQAYITAEIIESVEYNKPFLQGDEFDAVMNYNFAFLSEEFFINRKDRLKVSEFDNKLKILREAYDLSISYVMQNLFDSHDTNRLLSHIINADIGNYRDWGRYYGLSRGSNPDYSVRAPGEDHLRIQKLMVLFQMTYLGAPMIYYGDEAGMWGANDPCCRKPMIWDDLNYSDEKFNPNQSCREADKVEYNSVLADNYRKLIAVRNSEPALRRGDFRTVLKDDNNAVFAYARTYGKDEIIIVINNSAEEKETDIETDGHSDYQSLLSGKIYKSSVVGVQIKLSALSGEILKALK
ncbi:MAG: alpha-glucosidase C-terminal domain-containing protein, partial [Ignavibacteriales bacterium]|nr:alpha-glucosidase C-terminal domain-containing protein [Ignavibacteriales bacterium]